jgi:hypothetical protein
MILHVLKQQIKLMFKMCNVSTTMFEIQHCNIMINVK